MARVDVRVSEERKARYEVAAVSSGKTLSAWLIGLADGASELVGVMSVSEENAVKPQRSSPKPVKAVVGLERSLVKRYTGGGEF